MQRLGIYGGTFDPIHLGHLVIVEWIRDACSLDHVLLIPSAVPPHKTNNRLTDKTHRWAMAELALPTDSGLALSNIEMQSDDNCYTVDTLQALRDSHGPDTELSLIIGEDSLHDLPTWREPDRIAQMARILVARRAGRSCADIPDFLRDVMTIVETPEIGISSTMIRERARNRQTIRCLVPEKVEQYILDHNLYLDA
jgi:nicotinate-nucleotide adenylyltransferase